MKTKAALLLVMFTLVGGAIFTFFFKETVLAEVGTTQITDKEVRQAMKALDFLIENVPDEATVLDKIVKGQSVLELLKLKGVSNLEEVFHREIARHEGNPKAREKWIAAKNALGGDLNKLKKLILTPLAADRLAFQEGYLRDDEFNRNQIAQADAILEKVRKNPPKFLEIVKSEQLLVTEGKWLNDIGLVFTDPRFMSAFASTRNAVSARDSERQGIPSLAKLGKGEVLEYVVDNKSGWWIIKGKGPLPSGEGIKIEAAVVRRQPFRIWLQKNAQLVKVKRMTASELKKP